MKYETSHILEQLELRMLDFGRMSHDPATLAAAKQCAAYVREQLHWCRQQIECPEIRDIIRLRDEGHLSEHGARFLGGEAV